jgi:hypothetical protein
VYYFNQRTVTPAGGFVPDGGARTVSNSTYVQQNTQMKHLQVVGSVTGYAQAVTRMQIGDLRENEIQASIKGLYWDVETGLLWGNSASTPNGAAPQFDGLDTQINTFSGGTQNALDKTGGSLTLAMLDELIDMVESNAAEPVQDDSWMMVMSNTAVSKIAQIQTSQQRFEQVQVATGLIVPSYRGVPLVKSSFLQARGYSVGTVTATTATTGGFLPLSSTYKYQLSAVVARQGEIQPSVEVSQATGGSTSTNIITLAFTPPTGVDGLGPVLYKVYRTAAGGASGTETFLGYVDATVGVQSDGVTPIATTSIVDTGVALVPQNGSTVPGTLPAAYYGTNTAMLPPGAGQENIYLISRDRNNVVRPYVREVEPLDVYPTTGAPDTLPYALVTDTALAVRAQKFLGRLCRVAPAV